MDGSSEIAQAFGAKVGLTLSTQGLYLVTGRAQSPATLVKNSGGQVALEVGPRTLLAALRLSSYLAFQRHPDIVFIGPVSIDQERFEHFLQLIAL